MLTIRLPEATEQRLNNLAKETHKAQKLLCPRGY
jgi:predicted DNA-binding protein